MSGADTQTTLVQRIAALEAGDLLDVRTADHGRISAFVADISFEQDCLAGVATRTVRLAALDGEATIQIRLTYHHGSARHELEMATIRPVDDGAGAGVGEDQGPAYVKIEGINASAQQPLCPGQSPAAGEQLSQTNL